MFYFKMNETWPFNVTTIILANLLTVAKSADFYLVRGSPTPNGKSQTTKIGVLQGPSYIAIRAHEFS